GRGRGRGRSSSAVQSSLPGAANSGKGSKSRAGITGRERSARTRQQTWRGEEMEAVEACAGDIPGQETAADPLPGDGKAVRTKSTAARIEAKGRIADVR